jgi:hypothetical protein
MQKKCELSVLSELRVGVTPGWGVRLKRLMRHKPRFELEGRGRLLVSSDGDGLPPAAGPVLGHLGCQVVKDLLIVRERLGALLLITRSSCSPCGLRDGRRNADRKARY